MSEILRERPYTQADVEKLRGTVKIEYTLARRGAERLRKLLGEKEPVAALGCLTGNQAVQAVQSRAQGDLSERLASRRRRQPGRSDVSGPELLSGQFGTRCRPPRSTTR